MKIKTLSDLKSFFSNVPNQIVSIGVYAFDNVGLESLTDRFSIIALNYSLDTKLIEKKVKLLSLEKINPTTIHEIKRNSLSMLRTEIVQEYLDSLNNPIIISYKGRPKFEQICTDKGYISAVGNSKMFQYLDNKSNFRDLLVKNNLKNYPPFKSYIWSELLKVDYIELTKEFGQSIVIQGKGIVTKFIFSQNDWEAAKEFIKEASKDFDLEEKFLVSKYIKGKSASVTCVATKWGIFTANVQYQLIDIPELTEENGRTGFFCGHDWTASKSISDKVNLEATNFAKTFGEIIYKMGYKGFFGLDLMVEDGSENIYVNECNARMTGVLPTIDLIQYSHNQIPFLGLHCLEYLPEHLTKDIELDFETINASLKTKKDGSHFFISSGVSGPNTLEVNLKPGVYTLENGKLTYLREGYRLEDLSKNDEFIFSETPSANLRIDRLTRIGRVVTNNGVLDKDFKFNEYTKNIINAYKNNLKYRHISD